MRARSGLRSRHCLRTLAVRLVLVGPLAWLLASASPLAAVERFFLDARIRAFPVAPAPDLVIVDADQQSLVRRGEWPWPRSLHAALVDKLLRWGARLVVFDIIFSSTSGRTAEDETLARALRRAGPGRVVLSSLWSEDADAGPDGVVRSQLETPLPQFTAAHGTADVAFDPDGTVRRTAPLVREGEPSLALAALRILDPARAREAEARWGAGGAVLPLPGGARSYPTVSYANVLDGVLDPRIDPALGLRAGSAPDYPSFFRGKVVFVGSSDVGQHDIFTTAAATNGSLTPGVELQATLLAALRSGTLVRTVPPWLNGALAALLAGLVPLALRLLPWRAGAALSLAAATLYVLLAWWLYGGAHVAIPIGPPLVTQGVTLASLLAVTLWEEEREKQQVRSTFGRYVSPRVIEKILNDPERYRSAAAERRAVTVLFVDLAGFTSFSERTAPEQVQAVLNDYLREMTACILAEDGVLDKYIGDGVMALWGGLEAGDPAADAKGAMRAALAMQGRLDALNETWGRDGFPSFAARIGIHSGEALVGNFGSELQVNFTAVGDVVNTASRLEALNKEFSTSILVSSDTAALAGGGFRLRSLGASAIRGRTGVVELFELLGAEGPDV
jgi:adenylate cyclase